jgi:hypothetical protein
LSVVVPMVWSEFDVNETVSPATGSPLASVTVAVAVLVDTPSAAISAGES